MLDLKNVIGKYYYSNEIAKIGLVTFPYKVILTQYGKHFESILFFISRLFYFSLIILKNNLMRMAKGTGH